MTHLARSFRRALLLVSLLASGCEESTAPSDAGAGPDAHAPPGVDAARPGDPDAPTVGPSSPLVDPMCLDGMYREALPDRSASLDDLVAAYSPAGAEAFVQGVRERRYPHGWTRVRDGRGGFSDWRMTFLCDRSSAE
ncbi:MAG: hypothetical protein ACK5U8_11785, partial [Deltaproteobacteria bacterium]